MVRTGGNNRTHYTEALDGTQGRKGSTLTSRAYLPVSTRDRAYRLTVYTDMVKISGNAYTEPEPALHGIGGKRGVIRGFSKQSRKRLIEFIASVRYSGQLLFATLTYPDIFPLDPAKWERDFDTFRKRLVRAVPNWRALWRIEQVERKTGTAKGMIAPHYHLLIFTPYAEGHPGLDDIVEQFQTWAKAAWYDIVHSGDSRHSKHGVHVQLVRSRKHAYQYVSKYIAKTGDDPAVIGRRWGHIGEFDCSPSCEKIISQETYIQLRRIVKRWLRSRGRKFWRRFGRMSCLMGCTILGLGDGKDDLEFNAEASWLVFLAAAMQQERPV